MRISVFLAAALAGSLCVSGAGRAAPSPSPGAAATAAGAAAPAGATASAKDSPALAPVRKAFEKRFPEIDVDGVRATRFPGLYEVQIGTDVVYTDAAVDYVLQGSLIDAKTRVDLTAVRLQKLAEVPFSSLPLDLAIKQVKGDGSRKMAVFEDPNCGYCKQFHHTLQQVDNTTVYTFLFPVLSPDSAVKARDVWCSGDPARTWKDWMVDGKQPPAAQCSTPIDTILALGRKLNVQGTPAIIFADGTRVNGALPLPALRQKLKTLD